MEEIKRIEEKKEPEITPTPTPVKAGRPKKSKTEKSSTTAISKSDMSKFVELLTRVESLEIREITLKDIKVNFEEKKYN